MTTTKTITAYENEHLKFGVGIDRKFGGGGKQIENSAEGGNKSENSLERVSKKFWRKREEIEDLGWRRSTMEGNRTQEQIEGGGEANAASDRRRETANENGIKIRSRNEGGEEEQ